MRNLVRFQDVVYSLQLPDEGKLASDHSIVSMACNQALGKLYLLTDRGLLLCFDNHDTLEWKHSTQLMFEGVQEHWTTVDYVAVTSTVVCLSREGSIVCIEEDATSGEPAEPEQIGVIDGGIAAAAWHPDYSCIVLLTGNHSVLCMSNAWDVLNEVPFPATAVGTQCALSWKGDGALLSIVSTDDEDKLAKVRVLNPQLDVVATSRNVAAGEGSAALLKGLGHCAAFSTHGVYIAVHQRKPGNGNGGGGDQVALLEKNGLRHGDFDIRTPAVSQGFAPWEITALQWDLPSTLVAVAMRSYSLRSDEKTTRSFEGCVQLYYRENFHWYLKQQWRERDLAWLGFDAELAQRLYLTQRTVDGDNALRVIDLHWAVSRSETRDSSVCVNDGEKLLFTPLGLSVVPPPMSLFQQSLSALCAPWRSAVPLQTTFWTRPSTASSVGGKEASNVIDKEASSVNGMGVAGPTATLAWGAVSLVNERGDCALWLGDERGRIVRGLSLSLSETIRAVLAEREGETESVADELLRGLQRIYFRNALVTEGEDGEVVLHLLGSKQVHHDLSLSFAASPSLSRAVHATEDVLFSLRCETHALNAAAQPLTHTHAHTHTRSLFRAVRVLDGLRGAVHHATHVVNTHHDLALGVADTHTGEFNVVRLSLSDWQWRCEPLSESHRENGSESHRDGEGEREEPLLWLHLDETPSHNAVSQRSTHGSERDRERERVIATLPEASPQFTVVCNAQYVAEERAALQRERESESESGKNALSVSVSVSLSSPVKMEGLESEIKPFTVIALSHRNRLYCGDVLLVAGASSYAFSHSFSLLLFVTLGTKPHVHFASLHTLQRLSDDALQGEAALPLFECAEPRPVERGAKLVAAVADDSRVVVQLPRGNLETFEPRPMILLKAQRLLAARRVLDCLVLLRRQRVDMNYLVDFNPAAFMDSVDAFVSLSLSQDKADLLSLFVTALDALDVSVSKYHFVDRSMAPQRAQRREYIAENAFLGDAKVNAVCEALRTALLRHVTERDGEGEEDEKKSARAMNPLLCTYAKQRPPLLVDALQLIQRRSRSRSHSSAAVSATAAIKYLAFLAEGKTLFEAALGVCDFDMARAVARQCQMDPKAYLPLLEGFEIIGKGCPEEHSQTQLMHYAVNVHLQRWRVAVESWCRLLRCVHCEENARFAANKQHSEESEKERERERVEKMLSTLSSLSPAVLSTIRSENLFSLALLRLNALERDCHETLSNSVSASAPLINAFLSSLRKAFGERALSEMQYATAINAFLSTSPPCAEQAVQAALQQGDWLAALSLAGRFHALQRENNSLNPVQIAQEIVYTFKSNQEFASFAGGALDDEDGNNNSLVDNALQSGKRGLGNGEKDEEEDKALLAARLSVDYCKDCESAVAILCTAHKWMRAVEVASQQQRFDLFDEVFPAARSAAKDLLKFLRDRSSKFVSLVAELAALWANPAERLNNVASTDVDLHAELHAEEERENETNDNDDARSEFSAATRYSTSSMLSSTSSVRSGTSTLSILSDVSDKSSASLAKSETSATSFSISGLEHGLLSRGSANSFLGENSQRVGANGKVYKRDRTPRRQKRIERSRTKGHGKDVWALRREKALCQELLHTALSLGSLGKAVNELCAVLALTTQRADRFLSMDLTSAMQQLVKNVQSNTAPVAPAYPREWLVKRAMLCVAAFQDPKQRLEDKLNKRFRGVVVGVGGGEGDNGAARAAMAASERAREIALSEAEVDELVQALTWWQLAKSGIQSWFDSKLAHLQCDEQTAV